MDDVVDKSNPDFHPMHPKDVWLRSMLFNLVQAANSSIDANSLVTIEQAHYHFKFSRLFIFLEAIFVMAMLTWIN